VKYLTFASLSEPDRPVLGALVNGTVIVLQAARSWANQKMGYPPRDLPDSMIELISSGEAVWSYARDLLNSLEEADPLEEITPDRGPVGYRLEQVVLFPPLSRPMTLRDFYAFESHVTAANQIRGRKPPSEWYEFPVFYYTNPNMIFGPDENVPRPSYTQALDYELEIACIIGKRGINILPAQAEEYIFGYTIFNDWSARDVQRKEMKVGLGPAKGKDFASSLGPWIVTPDELQHKSTGRPTIYDLVMTARVNGEDRSAGNMSELHYSFGDMIARASQSVHLMPGDVLGSGTVGSGCLLELTRGEGPWLQPGDVVELEIECLGTLRNTVAEA
jgi:2-keto-4-pentenoate hydratase/2-oxohepta-3-ene-1,7-dioic acid hydratase in catechol pathway